MPKNYNQIEKKIQINNRMNSLIFRNTFEFIVEIFFTFLKTAFFNYRFNYPENSCVLILKILKTSLIFQNFGKKIKSVKKIQ